MAISQRTCANHPERMAIGICVITGKAICAECSTRYEGVNYSKEGLRILQERRRAASHVANAKSRGWTITAILTAPVFLYLLYLSYLLSLRSLIDLRQFMMK